MPTPVPLHSLRWSGGGGRRILLLHGITANAAGWWRVGPDLAERGWEATAVDLRGHGASPKADSYLFADQVADVLALGTGWDAVLGHSMGGTIAVLAASQQPGWSAGLVLQDPALMLPEPMSEVLEWLLEEFELGPSEDRIAAANPQWHPNDVAAKVEALRGSSAGIVRETVESNWNWMVLEEAGDLRIPTVIIGSDPGAGGIVAVAFGEWLAASPWIEYSMIPGSSHSVHRDDAGYDTYLSTLVEALDRLPTLGRRAGKESP